MSFTTWWFGFAACWLAGCATQKPARPPNVLILFMDDQRADTIAALGNPHIHTPHLDRLATSGLVFDAAYMQGADNGATCVPSRAMLLSGRSLFRIDERLLRDETWPRAFARAGYRTFLTGKWHNGAASLPRCFDEARAVFVGGMTDPLRAPLDDLIDGELIRRPMADRHACATFADEAIAFLQQGHDRPFFCYVPFDGPHDPHIVPADFPVRYDAATVPLPANFLSRHPFDNGELQIRDESLLPVPRPEAAVRQMLADYWRYVSYLDMQVGRILDALAASPHAADTIVVFAADSGVARGSHGLIGKQNCYEHSVRVPLILAGPGIGAGRTSALCYLFDLLPTLGARCGVIGPATSEGRPFPAVLADPTSPARTELVFGYRGVQRAYRAGRWKLIWYPRLQRAQLFDLASDPEEVADLAALPEHAGRIDAMRAAMARALAAHGDRLR